MVNHLFPCPVGVGTNFTRFYNILSAAMATGEYEKVANGKEKHDIYCDSLECKCNLHDVKVYLKTTCQ